MHHFPSFQKNSTVLQVYKIHDIENTGIENLKYILFPNKKYILFMNNLIVNYYANEKYIISQQNILYLQHCMVIDFVLSTL